MELRIKRFCFGKMQSIRSVNIAVIIEIEPLLIQQRLGNAHHAIIRASCGYVDFSNGQQCVCRFQHVNRLIQKFLGMLFHAGCPWDRMFRNNGVSAVSHCSSFMKIRLIEISWSRERRPINSLVRLIS